jgi:K+-transporting ATPase ATPase C chain
MRPAVSLFLLLTLITGVAYPFMVTSIGAAIFPHQAAGSLIMQDGKAIGSELIGQNFSAPKYFWGRPSGTSPMPYNGAASSGTNLGPLNPTLTANITARIDALRTADPGNTAAVPIDLVTASGSGLDPHISPAAAYYQTARVARERNLTEATVLEVVDRLTEKRQFGIFGEPRVNVLALNLALDQLQR